MRGNGEKKRRKTRKGEEGKGKAGGGGVMKGKKEGGKNKSSEVFENKM